MMHKTHVKPKDYGSARRRPVEQIVAEIISVCLSNKAGHLTIAVGGPGGTGKSTLAKRLAELLPDSAVFRLDDYKTSREVRRLANIFGPHPDANKMALIAEHLQCIKIGQLFDKPVYDASAGDSISTETYVPARMNIIDGEIATYREFRDFIDFSIFIDANWRTQLETRLSRDTAARNYNLDKAVATFLHSNLREFTQHGAESKAWADLHLFCQPDYRLQVESVSRELYEQAEHILHHDLEDIALEGLIVPLLTPFQADGSLHRAAFAEHLSWLAQKGVRRILVGGTTGEFFSLTDAERLELLKLAMEYFPGLVLFQAATTCLKSTIALAGNAESLGADGIACLPPYFYAGAPVGGLIEYLCKVSESVSIPLILYNFPRHTNNAITKEILARVPHAALKDSSADLSLIASTPKYFVGDDAAIIRACRAGAIGFVSGPANIVPESYISIEAALFEQDWEKMEDAVRQIGQILNELTAPYDIPQLKQLLASKLPAYPVSVRPPLSRKI